MDSLKRAALNRAVISIAAVLAGMLGSYILEWQPVIHAAICKGA